MTLRCLDALRAVDWPDESLEVVLVDNASIDGIAPRVRAELPWVHLIEHTHNVGFAGGCNLGLADLDDVDYVALLNNDAVPDPTGSARLSPRSSRTTRSAPRARRSCSPRRS